MSNQANTHTTAEQIAEALIENGWIDFGGGSASLQVRKAIEDLIDVVTEYVEVAIVTSEADASPADGSYA